MYQKDNRLFAVRLDGSDRRVLGAVAADSSGVFSAILDTHLAGPGSYTITADASSASIKFHLDPHATLWPQEGSGPIFELPAGIANQDIYLPVIFLRAAFG